MNEKELELLKSEVKNDFIKEHSEFAWDELITAKIEWLGTIKENMESVFKRDNKLFRDEVIQANLEKHKDLSKGEQLFELAITSTALEVFYCMKQV